MRDRKQWPAVPVADGNRVTRTADLFLRARPAPIDLVQRNRRADRVEHPRLVVELENRIHAEAGASGKKVFDEEDLREDGERDGDDEKAQRENRGPGQLTSQTFQD